jgi:hypothetical protein
VSCGGCHLQIQGHEKEVATAGEVSCMACHGTRYRSVLGRWEQSLTERIVPLRRQLQNTTRLFPGREPEGLMDARHNLELVERGRGVHNVRFAFALIEKSHEFMNEAREEAGHSAMPLPWARAPFESPCLDCHQGIENHTAQAFGRSFRHGVHVMRQKLDCSTCHRTHEEREVGEVLRFGVSGCSDCHHQSAGDDCKQCHAGGPRRTVPSFRGSFSHDIHVGMGSECADCHRAAEGKPAQLDRDFCAACHD